MMCPMEESERPTNVESFGFCKRYDRELRDPEEYLEPPEDFGHSTGKDVVMPAEQQQAAEPQEETPAPQEGEVTEQDRAIRSRPPSPERGRSKRANSRDPLKETERTPRDPKVMNPGKYMFRERVTWLREDQDKADTERAAGGSGVSNATATHPHSESSGSRGGNSQNRPGYRHRDENPWGPCSQGWQNQRFTDVSLRPKAGSARPSEPHSCTLNHDPQQRRAKADHTAAVKAPPAKVKAPPSQFQSRESREQWTGTTASSTGSKMAPPWTPALTESRHSAVRGSRSDASTWDQQPSPPTKWIWDYNHNKWLEW